jgi:CHAD domain-containing protein
MLTLADLTRAEAWQECPDDPLASVAQEVLDRERERVFRRDRTAAQPGANRAVALHDVRKAAKRLRYAAEAAGPDHEGLATRAQALQDLLGEANDGLATAAWLDRAARAHPEHREFVEHGARQWSAGHVDPAAYEALVSSLRESSA